MKAIIFTATFLLIFTITSEAQMNSIEGEAIQETIHNYIENFFENNFEEMNKSIHPRLAKRGLNQDGTLSTDFPPEKLKELMETKPKFEKKNQYNVVKDIVIFGNMA